MNDQVDKKQFEQDFKKRKLKGIKMLSQKANDVLYEVHLGETIVKQSQFDILLAEINKINNKMDEGFNKVNHRLDKVETRLDVIESDVSEIKIVLKKHDDAMVEHGWFNKSNMN